jgi:thiol:disulfide interchange protein
MKQLLCMLLVAAAALGCGEGGSRSGFHWETDFDAALARARKENKIVMVDVYTDWCGYCKKLDREVYANPRVQEKLSEMIVPVKVNPEKSVAHARVAHRFGTKAYPHIIFVNANNETIHEIPGYLPLDYFLQTLDRINELRNHQSRS